MPNALSRGLRRALSLAAHNSLWLLIAAAFVAVLIRPCVTAWHAGMAQDATDRWQKALDFHEATAPGSYPNRDAEIRSARRRLAELYQELRQIQDPWPAPRPDPNP